MQDHEASRVGKQTSGQASSILLSSSYIDISWPALIIFTLVANVSL